MSEANKSNPRPSEPELFLRIENTKKQLPNSQDDSNNSTDWEALARKLRQRNLELAKTLVQLEQALAESQENLQSQIRHSHSTDTLLAQQAEELNTTQEQYTFLCQDLEASEQNVQRQQILLETLNKQLEASQQQVAKLERECALLSESNNEQNHKYLETEKQVQELRARLSRQQRYTLQFKAALEQCLEVPWPKNAIGKQSLGRAASVVPKVKPIQPWSAQDEQSDRFAGIDRLRNQEPVVVPKETAQIEQEEKSNRNGKVKEILLPSFKVSHSSVNMVQSNPAADTSDLPLEKADSATVSEEAIQASQYTSASPKSHNATAAKKRKSTNAIDLPKFQRQN